ncbi:DUF2092 domain-containing protein [Flavitalea antarctica]
MKKLVLISFVGLISQLSVAQPKTFDSLAVLIIDRMADVIGDLESCSYALTTATDVEVTNHMQTEKSVYIKYFTDYTVYMGGSNKMLINAYGYKGHRQYMYNGKQFAYYSFDENNYGLIPAPATVIKTFDSLSDNYGIEFPAADFFYPALTDDILAHSDSLRYLGIEKINAKEYFHIIAFNPEEIIQFWINNDAYNLPARFSITYKKQPGNPQYLAIFSEWQINPRFPEAMFEFVPPPGAGRLRIQSKNE